MPVDVVVPAYNAAWCLRACLASIYAQTVDVGRVIVVDDGSTDATASVAREFPCVLIRVNNNGVAEARNIGIRATSAPYVAFLDADDAWHPEKLAVQFALGAFASDVRLVACDARTWSGAAYGGPLLDTHANFSPVKRERIAGGYIVRREAMVRALAVRNFTLPSTFVVDRALFDDDGLYFTPRSELPQNDGVFIGEDLEWLMRVLRHSDVAFADRVLLDYRLVQTSLSAKRGRIRYGDAILGDRMAAAPDRYALGAPEAFAQMRVRVLEDSAIAHLRAGESRDACARFRELATTQRTSPRRVAYALAYVLLRTPGLRRLTRWIGMLPRPRFIPQRATFSG